MMKKTIFFMLCLAPMGAQAAFSFDNPLTGSGAVFSDSVSATNVLIGYSVPENPDLDNNIYTADGAGPDFSLFYNGDASGVSFTVTNELKIENGYSLALGVDPENTNTIAINLDSVNANGNLTITGVNTLTAKGVINAAADLNIAAGSMTSGVITNATGNTDIDIAGDLDIDGFHNTGAGNADIAAGTIVSDGDIENSGTAGNVSVAAESVAAESGGITVGGNIYNSSSNGMTVDAKGDIAVTGTIKNDSNDGTLNITGASLTVSGGDSDNASFVNKGNLNINIAGKTNLANGFDLSAMGADNTFSLTTGSLDLGAGADRWLGVFTNKLNEFTLIVKQGTVSTAQGTAWIDVTNNGGDMRVHAPTIAVGNVTNNGNSLEIGNFEISDTIVDGTNSVTVNGDVRSSADAASTEIASAGSLTVKGSVVHNGASAGNVMALYGGDTVQIDGSVSNVSGGTLNVAASVADGTVTIGQSVTNASGEINIDGNTIAVNGALVSSGGNININATGDDNNNGLTVGSIDADAGAINLNNLAGGVTVNGVIDIQSGATLNIAKATSNVTAAGSISIDGDVTVGAASDNGGDIVIAASGVEDFTLKSNYVATDGENQAALNIGGNINVTAAGAHNVTLAAGTMSVGDSVNVSGATNTLVLGDEFDNHLSVTNSVTVDNGGTLELVAGTNEIGGGLSINNGSKFVMHTGSVVAGGAIDIDGGLYFDGNAVNDRVGLIADEAATELELVSDTSIDISGVLDLVSGKTLTLTANNDGGVTVGGAIENAGALSISGGVVTVGGIRNVTGGTVGVVANAGDVTVKGNVANGGDSISIASENGSVNITGGISNNVASSAEVEVDIAAAGTVDVGGSVDVAAGVVAIGGNGDNAAESVIVGGDVSVSGGRANIAAADIDIGGALSVTSGQSSTTGAVQIVDASSIDVTGNVTVTGDVIQGTVTDTSGTGTPWALNLDTEKFELNAVGLTVSGDYTAMAGTDGLWNLDGTAEINESLTVGDGAKLTINADGITLGSIAKNAGDLTLDSGAGVVTISSFDVTGFGANGTITLAGAGLTTAGKFTTGTVLNQNVLGDLIAGQVGINSDNYTISSNAFTVSGINQDSGELLVNTNSVVVNGDIDALGDVRFARLGDDWLDITVDGNVSGGVDFWGVQKATINGDYTFNNSSDLWAVVFNDATTADGKDYWSSITDDGVNKFGEITNAEQNAGALIEITDGKMISNITGVSLGTNDAQPTVGVTLFENVDMGDAIWLVHADGGIDISDGFEHLRNLDVKFCNADGSICIDYASSIKGDGSLESGSEDNGLPIYITERDSDGDGKIDSLYVVFNPNYGGPIEVFKLQPIVAGVPSHTDGEYVSAGALDDLIAGQIINVGFSESAPIEILPAMFKGTNFAEMADALYDRMENYYLTGDADPLARFSRLFQARELEQIAGAVALNEHTNFRDFEDRMFDEFIWNRNRSLSKAWVDVDYGFVSQNVQDGRAYGDRFSIAAGFDWQDSETTILGLTAHVSNSSTDNSDVVDLGYLPDTPMRGFADMTVDDWNVGVGGYMMKILGEKTRLYGNAFLDVHIFDIARNQTFMNPIDGSGTAFSLISEWGLMHDWLNQYIVGNAYARVGYNFGFDVTETSMGQDYMDMQSDGYLILTPGYSLIAQKRIYPSAWFQIRPYASIGVEYDVLGAPDFVKYKFAPAHTYTKYDIDIDPLWANIGGGVEFLSAMGLQFGIDYRYQYNDAIQLHNIKVTGSYRF